MNPGTPPTLLVSKVPSTEATLRALFWKLLFRGRTSQHAVAHKNKKTLGLGMTLVMYGIFGLVPALTAYALDTFVFASLLHAYTLMFASLSLAASAGTMLFMREEAEILLHRPVTPRQLLRAKMSVLAGFSLVLAFALNAAGLVGGLWSKGATWRFIPAHMISTLLLMVFSAASIVLVYNLCLKWLGRERLDNLLATLQTLLTILMIVSGQLMPRALGMRNVGGIENFSNWMLALPPVWFGALDTVISGKATTPLLWMAAGLSIAVTGVISWLAFGLLGSAYGEGLMALNETAGAMQEGKPRARRLEKVARLPFFHWWLRNPLEKQAFMLTAAYMFRDREMKLRLYPSIAPLLIMPLVMLFSSAGRAGSAASEGLQAFASCYLGIIPLQGMLMLQRSEHWRAATLFYITPLPHWAPAFHGSRKAVLGLLTFPVMLLQGGIISLIQSSWTPLLMMLPALFFLPVFSLVPGLLGTWLPLSKPNEEQRDAGMGCLLMAGVMAVSALLGGMTWWTWKMDWFWVFLALEAAGMLVAFWLTCRVLRSMEWSGREEE